MEEKQLKYCKCIMIYRNRSDWENCAAVTVFPRRTSWPPLIR